MQLLAVFTIPECTSALSTFLLPLVFKLLAGDSAVLDCPLNARHGAKNFAQLHKTHVITATSRRREGKQALGRLPRPLGAGAGACSLNELRALSGPGARSTTSVCLVSQATSTHSSAIVWGPAMSRRGPRCRRHSSDRRTKFPASLELILYK